MLRWTCITLCTVMSLLSCKPASEQYAGAQHWMLCTSVLPMAMQSITCSHACQSEETASFRCCPSSHMTTHVSHNLCAYECHINSHDLVMLHSTALPSSKHCNSAVSQSQSSQSSQSSQYCNCSVQLSRPHVTNMADTHVLTGLQVHAQHARM